MSEYRVSFSQLEAFITQAMVSLGLPPEDAQTVGHLMAEADMQGSDGHGVIRLVPYAKRILAGGMNL
ncbi:MAG: Ldh family oxidoreductase, partial [Betaproteobacteria bacterium]|nr:Ldh family oxidoreductase [Betaproteobacteria bacterium]